MKKLILFSFTIIFCGNIMQAQCPQGAVSLSSQTEVDNFAALYPNCTEIVGDLLIGRAIGSSQGTNIADLNALSQITAVGGDLGINYNYTLLNLNGLEGLVSVGGNLSIQSNFYLTTLDPLSSLTSVGNNIDIKHNDGLISLSGFVENFTSVTGDLSIIGNNDLTDLSGLENVVSIGQDLDIIDNDALVDFSELQQLTSIGGDLYLSFNFNLLNFNGLHNITSVGGDLYLIGNTNIENFVGLESLNSIGGNLWAAENIGLTNFVGLENLSSIGGHIWADENDNLLNFNGLESVTSIGSNIRIRYNPRLISLYGLQNIAYSTISDLDIHDNPVLSICSLSNICFYIQTTDNYNIHSNATGCSEADLSNICSTVPQIRTDVFYDFNQNKIHDTYEPNYPDASILIEPISDLYYAHNNGTLYIEAGSYTAIFSEANNPNWQLTTDSVSYFLSLEDGETESIDFGIYPTQQISDIQTTISSPPVRCNEIIILDITAKNLGTTTATGILWFTIDDAIPAFNFIDQPDLTAGTNAYGWYFIDLYPGQSITKNVEILVPGPPEFELGQQLLFVSFSEYTDENGDQTTEAFRYNPEVLCSFDPNDKLVNPNREGDYVLFEEDLIYTIRFQNTGNDVAYDVTIRDTLDTNLDQSTFRFLSSSHADKLSTNLSDGGILTFEFTEIFLPDSTSNFEESQGYISYLIHTVDGLAEETPVNNSAGIYFDLNPPVITNTTQSIMVSELPTVSTETPNNSFNINVLPNPNDGIFTLQGISEGTYQIFNSSGQIIKEGNVQNNTLIDISNETQGIYFISVTIENETFLQKIVKM